MIQQSHSWAYIPKRWKLLIEKVDGEFPGGLVVRTLRFHCRGQGSVPGRGTKILQAARHGQKKSKGTRTPVFIAALFIIAKTSKQPTGLRRCDIYR